MLSNEEFDAYLAPLPVDQAACIRAVRSLIEELNPFLTEEIDTGKWFGGLLTYHTEDRIIVFALGPLSGGFTTFHMMAFYGSSALRERQGEALKKLLSGKSCIKFKTPPQIPENALRDIIGATPKYLEVAREMTEKRRNKSLKLPEIREDSLDSGAGQSI
jgi:hypothetical protein